MSRLAYQLSQLQMTALHLVLQSHVGILLTLETLEAFV